MRTLLFEKSLCDFVYNEFTKKIKLSMKINHKQLKQLFDKYIILTFITDENKFVHW